MECKYIYKGKEYTKKEILNIFSQNITYDTFQRNTTETLNTTNNEETRITELGEPGRDRRRWDPSRGNQTLEGAPVNTKRKNVTGADPELTYWAEEYAKRVGIDYKRQSKYVEVDVDRAMRIAEAYDAMEHAPQDPEVKEAYQNLINQTIAQYNILVEGGYQFYFFDETNDPYNGNPMAAMEELRNEKRMGSFATEAGFGTGNEGLDVSDNPMLQDTGLTWGWGSVDGEPKRVLANDLFRAVHDAFGHGLEGAGFRARGEENAWQAHARLFTGSAVAAITSETRGQNSWLNFGKYGEQNRTAKVEDTVFAPQKTGLMPEWTWQEGFDEGKIYVNYENHTRAGKISDPSGVLNNEISHNIQEIEGFTRGGSEQELHQPIGEYFNTLREGNRGGSSTSGVDRGLIEDIQSVTYDTFQNNNLRSHMFIENNSKLGSIRTKPTQRGEKVDSAIVYEAYRGQGVGTELYLETVRNLMIEGKILESDNSQTAPAKRIWEKLVEWGLAIKTGESNFESVPAPSWMTAETTIDEVINNQPIDRSEPSLQELMTYINFQGEANVTKTEVIELMQANEILDSHELLERLSRAEEQGIFIFTLERLKQTGLFENYEAHKILESKERQGKIKDTLKWLRQNDNFEIQPTQLEKGGSLLSTGKIERQAEESEVTVQDLEGNQIKSNVRLSETITFDYNETLSNNIAFLNQIVRETTWDSLSSQVKDILNSIEVSALDNGIDLRGLSEKYHSATREDILGFLNSLENTLEGNISPQEFEVNRNEFLNFDSITENKEVSRTEVVLGDRLDADVALRDYNLLKVAPDVYKRVPSITYTELLQAEANRRGVEAEVLNREVNENFDRSLEDVEQAKLIYLLNSNLNTQETKIQPNLSKLDTFQGNFDYIVEQFPKDFGKWAIETNNNYFKLDWRGITLTNPNQSELAFESVPDYFKEDLLEYSKLSKYLNFNREFDLVYDLDSLQVERDRVINNAQALEEYKGDYVTLKNGEGIMIRNGQGQFIKLNGLVFEQVDEHNNLVFYKPLPKLNEDSLMEIEIPKPVLESNVFDYTLYQTQAKEIENLNRETNRTDYEC